MRANKPSSGSLNLKLAGLLAANLVLGAAFSPATAPHHLRVAGAPKADEARIAAALQLFAGVPSRQIHTQHFAQSVLTNSEVQRIESNVNILGRGVVQIHLQTPVATIVDSKVALAADGSVLQLSRDPGEVPRLTLHSDFRGPNWIPAGIWPARSIAWLIREVSRWKADKAWTFDLDSRGVMSFRGSEKAKIVVGTPVELEKKWSRFTEELAKQPNLLESVQEINISAPADIVIKR